MSCQIYYYVPLGVYVQNLVGIDSVVMLRMREKHVFVWMFLLTYLSIFVCLSVSSSRLWVTVLRRFQRLMLRAKSEQSKVKSKHS